MHKGENFIFDIYQEKEQIHHPVTVKITVKYLRSRDVFKKF